jgi:hypothetical protein
MRRWLVIAALAGCVEPPPAEPTPTPSVPPAPDNVAEGVCLGPQPIEDCEPELVAGAPCTVRVTNDTSVTLETLGFPRRCALEATDVDGYPTPPTYPVLTGGTWAPGETLEQVVLAAPYGLSAGASDQASGAQWGWADEFVCSDGEDIDLTLTDAGLLDGVLWVQNDGPAALIDVRVAAQDAAFGDNLLDADVLPGGTAWLNPPDGAGWVQAVDAAGTRTWTTWLLAVSRSSCFFTAPGEYEPPFVGEPCRLTIDNLTGATDVWLRVGPGYCADGGHPILPPSVRFVADGRFDVLAPPGDWALLLGAGEDRYEVYGVSCGPGESQTVEVGPEHLVLDDPCE